MQILIFISNIFVPLLLFFILAYGLSKRIPVYDTFLIGAKDGLHTVVQIVPTIVGLMIAVAVLRASGFLDFLGNIIGHLTSFIHFPGELAPLVLVKIFSSSAATSILLDIYKEFGTDSRLGLIGSIILSSTETVFYTMSIYFLHVKITKTRWTLAGALLATLGGIIASVLIVGQ